MNDEFSRLKTIFDNAPLGVFLTTLEGRFVNLNNQLAKIFGYSSVEEIIESIQDLSKDLYAYPEDRYRMLKETKDKNDITSFEVKFKKKNGELIDARMSIRPYKSPDSDNNYFIGIVEDITEQKRLIEQVKESERKYRSLFENSNDAIYILHHNGEVEFNEKAREIFELPPQLETFNIIDISPEYQPDGKLSSEKIDFYIKNALKGETQKFEWLSYTFKSREVYCDVTVNKLEKGIESSIIAVVRDITEEKKAELKLKESEKRYRHLVDNAPMGIVRTKLNGEIVFVNNKMLDILGFENFEEAIKYFPKMPSVYQNAEDRHALINELGKGKILNSRLQIKGKNKSQHIINFMAAPEVNNKGEIEFINSIVEDIGEKERLENKIKEREETLSSVVNSFPFELVVTDKKDNLIVQNSFSKSLYGDLEGNKVKEFLVPGESHEIWEKHAKEVFGNKVLDYERDAVRNNQSYHFRIIKAPLIIHNQVSGIITMSINITERIKLQQEIENHRDNLEELVKKRTEEVGKLNKKLLLTNEELSAANKFLSIQKSELEELVEELKQTQNQLIMSEKMASIGILTAGIAHEINNPVNFISSGLTGLELIVKDIHDVLLESNQIDIIKQTNGDTDEFSKAIESLPKLIKSMRTGILRTTEIVKGLRTFSRLDNENKTYSNVNELIDSTLVILTNKYKHRIKIEKDYKFNAPINCFPSKLSQVFLNLIVNAIQAIPDKGKISIQTYGKENGEEIIISIKDNGEGIPDSYKTKIFDPFFTTKPVGEGTGLGLAIVHGIIQEHEGKIDLISEKNVGTEFILTLPVN